jgi:hypothetical protein
MYLENRLNMYPVSEQTKEKELIIIKNTPFNNNCNINKAIKHLAL